jgi:CHAD domain-containing protein
LGPKDQKLLQQLDRIRKRAGKVRDIDVQVAALSSVSLDRGLEHKYLVQTALERKRRKRVAKLTNVASDFSDDSLRKLKRLGSKPPSTASGSKPPFSVPTNFAGLAMRHLAEAAAQYNLNSHRHVDPESLHGFRLALKRVRYTAEMASNDVAAEHLVEQTKKIQDVLGEWRDFDALTTNAEKELKQFQTSALLALLKNMTGAKLSTAVRVSIQVTNELLSASPPKKVPESVGPDRRAKAAALKN